MALWFLSFDLSTGEKLGLGSAQLEMMLLQSVSFLLLVCAVQLPPKASPGWRPAILTMAFVALSQSSIVALLTPVG